MIQPVRATNARSRLEARWVALGAAALVVIVAAVIGFSMLSAPKTPVTAVNLDAEMLRVAKGLYCPVCPSTPLDVCETQACVQWRALIREKLANGESEQDIRAYFVAQYGERVLGAPPAEGFNISAYVFPFILLIAGLAFLTVTMRRWQLSRAALAAAEPEASDEQPAVAPDVAKRIRREMKERE
ncbi:MAG: cytochrome c-type biogenesis protein CcmH [Chloroflexi bacterium]|nr:cytochrome c-type biogenesis protein CcmH [Chloroflexota bacterium]